MPVLQYKCNNCFSVFEHLVSAAFNSETSCVSCDSMNVARTDKAYFYPNKAFCPHDKLLDEDVLKVELSGILKDEKNRCGGCGSDGAPGKCNSSGGGCGSACSCGKATGGCKSNVKSKLDTHV